MDVQIPEKLRRATDLLEYSLSICGHIKRKTFKHPSSQSRALQFIFASKIFYFSPCSPLAQGDYYVLIKSNTKISTTPNQRVEIESLPLNISQTRDSAAYKYVWHIFLRASRQRNSWVFS